MPTFVTLTSPRLCESSKHLPVSGFCTSHSLDNQTKVKQLSKQIWKHNKGLETGESDVSALESQTFRLAAAGRHLWRRLSSTNPLVRAGLATASCSQSGPNRFWISVSKKRDFTTSVENVFLCFVISAVKCFSLYLTGMSHISVVPISSCHISCPVQPRIGHSNQMCFTTTDLRGKIMSLDPVAMFSSTRTPRSSTAELLFSWLSPSNYCHTGLLLSRCSTLLCFVELHETSVSSSQSPSEWQYLVYPRLLPVVYQLQSFTGCTLTHCPLQWGG